MRVLLTGTLEEIDIHLEGLTYLGGESSETIRGVAP